MCPPESERAAFHESSQATIQKNRETIQQLRQENKRLCREQAEANAVSPRETQATFSAVLGCVFLLSSFEQSKRSYLTFFYSLVPFGVSPPRVMKWPFITEAWRRECQGR